MSRFMYPAFPGEDGMPTGQPTAYPTTHSPYAPAPPQLPSQPSPVYGYHSPANHRQLAPAPYVPPQSPSPSLGLQLERAIQLEDQARKSRKTSKNQTPGQGTFRVQLNGQDAGDPDGNGDELRGVGNGSDVDEDEQPVEDPNEDNTPPEGMYYLPPPPERTYKNYDECHQAMHDWNKAHGFDVSRQKPAKNKNGDIYKYLYQCTRHGRRGNKHKVLESERKRKRESKKTGCPMGIYIRAVDVKNVNGKWRISHQLDGRSKWHNHEGISAEELTGHRRRNRTEEMKALIKQTRAAGMDAWQSLAYIKEKMPGALITKQDVLNYRKQDPGPGSDTHNYLDKAYMLAVSFGSDFEIDDVYGMHLLPKLRTRMPISICSKPESLAAHLQRNPPRVVLVTDPALAYPENRLHLARLVTYVQDGGTMIFMAHFNSTPRDYMHALFLHHLNLDWSSIDVTSTPLAYSLNDKLAAGGTGGRWVVVARNFAPGTDAKAIEQLAQLSPGTPALISCRLYSTHPVVTAELVFGAQDSAEAVISAFSGKSVNLGRLATAPGKELDFALRAPAPMATSDLAPEIIAKANALRNVQLEDVVYAGVTMVQDSPAHQGGYVNGVWVDPQVARQSNVEVAGAAYRKVGKGYVGYVGLGEFDDNYLRCVAAMCHF
ncbi:uncharacterized protein PV09_07071 [Verruconis gallopava]|uniref:FAR1 domain-containing protein n=1 Tax=Verruconis gallopava TaxID=253628 RepID=A0A0D2AQY8_9PEZI|nr:uncharacterized protein PV09_07071 [Verruconis gallopava]KIW01599.1 hypothetical protein PV09_07071 [Verruconis gallopava]